MKALGKLSLGGSILDNAPALPAASASLSPSLNIDDIGSVPQRQVLKWLMFPVR